MSFTVGGSTPQLTFADATVQNTAFTGLNQSATPFATSLGYQALNSNTGANNTAVGYQAGYYITTGAKNTIIGAYNGNQGGLDIRTSNNYIVLSDGDGNPAAFKNNGDTWTFGTGTTTASGNITLAGSATSGWGAVIAASTGALGSQTYQWYIGSNSNIKGGTTYSTLTCTAGGTAGGVNLASGATAWATASDARLKNVTGTFTNALADIAQIEAVKFTWKADEEGKPQVGVIAQSVQGVVPEAIETIRVNKNDETDYLSVKYTELIPLMIASIQALKAEFDAYKAAHP